MICVYFNSKIKKRDQGNFGGVYDLYLKVNEIKRKSSPAILQKNNSWQFNFPLSFNSNNATIYIIEDLGKAQLNRKCKKAANRGFE